MKAIIKIDMDNAAFDDEPGWELARILRSLADQVEEGFAGPHNRQTKFWECCRDINGSTVGQMEVKS